MERNSQIRLSPVGSLLGALVLGAHLATAVLAHEDGAESGAEAPDLARAQQSRAERLFGIVICNCPKEDWTRTLAGCANSCADGQKNEVRKQVLDGWSDDQILEDQAKKYGPKAVGRTSAAGFSGFLIYGGPFVVLAVFTVAVVLLLRKLTKKLPVVATGAVSASGESLAAGTQSEEDRKLGDEIDRELAEMDEA